MKKIIIMAMVVLILAGGGYYLSKAREHGPKFRVHKVTKGNIKSVVTATGTVNAVTTVLVGTQASGTIRQLCVDYNSAVKKGQLLARIDPAIAQAQVEQAGADLRSSVAGMEKAAALLLDAKRTVDRNRSLFVKNFIARSVLDTTETNYQYAQAQLNVAQAQVCQSRAALRLAEANLNYTRILSPVDGMVISRNVDIGQTVVASFQTPTLFKIAQDLTKMQVDAGVDEADIGRIQLGQEVVFNVDAFPEILFQGKVAEIRNAPTTIENVVTYTVVVKVANPEYKLKPGMTAHVSIVVSTRQNILRIPNSALRVKLADGQGAEKVKEKETERGPKPSGELSGIKRQFVWVPGDQGPKRVAVATGISDGNFTELLAGDLKEADKVIVEATASAKKRDSSPRSGSLH